MKTIEQKIKQYAQIIVKIGANVQKNQIVIINSIIEAAPLTRLVVEECYKVGAKEVIVRYSDAKVSKLKLLNESIDTLKYFPDWMVSYHSEAVLKHGACRIAIRGDSPEALKGVDPLKLKEVSKVTNTKLKELSDYIMAGKTQWVVACYPTVEWAQIVFPKENPQKAVSKLLDAILKTVRIDGKSNPILEWKQHNDYLAKQKDILNKYNFDYLHITNKLGTDIKIKLIKNHVWGSGRHEGKITYTANMPTEEVWTMPYKYGLNGTVVASKPLSYQGNVIDKFSFTFKNGKVVSFKAEKNEAVLKSLLETDEGSKYTGEIALVPVNSPINQMNILFYSTLYDENAACHIALGAAYPTNVKNGANLKRAELDKLGVNNSLIHVDFMFGTSDTNIVGYTYDNEKVQIMTNGKYNI